MGYHLQGGDVLLPPDVLLEAGSHGSQHVVGVHDDVHEGVDDADERAMSPGVVLSGSPGHHGHHGVMVHVQEGNLAFLFAQDEEHSIQ